MSNGLLLEEKLTGSIIGAFYDVYNTLGYRFLEHLYVIALERELRLRAHDVTRELSVRVRYKGEELGAPRLDMVVDRLVVVEARSTHALDKIAPRRLYNYLRATNLEIGLRFHFGPQPKFYRALCENRLDRRPNRSVTSVPSG